jgi:CysZ protein
MAQTLRDAHFITRFIKGIGYLPLALGFIWQHRSLWKYILIPVLISVVVFAATFAVSFSYTNALINHWLTPAPEVTAPAGFWAKVWHGLKAVFAPILKFFAKILAGAILILLVSLLSFLVVGSTLMGPFTDLLSEKTEILRQGRPVDSELSFKEILSDLKRVLIEELKKSGFFLGCSLIFVILGFIPVITVVTALASTIFTIFFVSLAYVDLPMERRRYLFKQKLNLFLENKFAMFGFGCGLTLLLMVPVLNFFVPPLAAVGATLLFLDLGYE